MHRSFGSILGRVAAIVGALLCVGILLRLVVAILQPVLPELLWRDLAAGWELLYSVISPAVPPVIAVGVLCAIGWVILGNRR